MAVTPQLIGNTIITSKVNWVQISGTFVAAGGEQFITVGLFKDFANRQESGIGAFAYYYIDDICIAVAGSGICNIALPIELLDFNAELVEDKTELTWITQSETNNDYFVIERSADGMNFEGITSTPGAGNSTSLLHYQAVDPSPLTGTSYYRLKQIDFNGEFSYSEVKTVINEEIEISLINLNPNPVNDLGKLKINSQKDRAIVLTVNDVIGKMVYQEIYNLHKGINEINLDFSKQNNGVYFIEAVTENWNKSVIKIIKN